MNRAQLEHAIRAACDILGRAEVFVIGSQSILGQHPDAPRDLRVSNEVDILPIGVSDAAGEHLNAIGEYSPFHSEFGFYVDPVTRETAILPTGWEDRAVRVDVSVQGVTCTGWCLEPHDLAVAKLFAGREKDIEFVGNLFFHRMVKHQQIDEQLGRVVGVSEEDVAYAKLRLQSAKGRSAGRKRRNRGA